MIRKKYCDPVDIKKRRPRRKTVISSHPDEHRHDISVFCILNCIHLSKYKMTDCPPKKSVIKITVAAPQIVPYPTLSH